MIPKLCLHRTRSLTLLKLKSGLLKLFNHLASCKSSQVAIVLCRWTLRYVFGDGAEFFTLVQSCFDVFCFCFVFDQYMRAVNFIYHKPSERHLKHITFMCELALGQNYFGLIR